MQKPFKKTLPLLLTGLAILGLTACTGYSDYDEYHENGYYYSENGKLKKRESQDN